MQGPDRGATFEYGVQDDLLAVKDPDTKLLAQLLVRLTVEIIRTHDSLLELTNIVEKKGALR